MLKKSSFICAGLLLGLNSMVFAEPLSQSAYDEFISAQTKIVNETKHILDEGRCPNSTSGFLQTTESLSGYSKGVRRKQQSGYGAHDGHGRQKFS